MPLARPGDPAASWSTVARRRPGDPPHRRRCLSAGGYPAWRLLGVVAEAVGEAAEDATLVGQRRAVRRGLGALLPDGLVVLGPGDGVHDLSLVEVLRPGDLRHEAHQVAVQQDLGL